MFFTPLEGTIAFLHVFSGKSRLFFASFFIDDPFVLLLKFRSVQKKLHVFGMPPPFSLFLEPLPSVCGFFPSSLPDLGHTLFRFQRKAKSESFPFTRKLCNFSPSSFPSHLFSEIPSLISFLCTEPSVFEFNFFFLHFLQEIFS